LPYAACEKGHVNTYSKDLDEILNEIEVGKLKEDYSGPISHTGSSA
jgi:hypothetical protein